MTTEPVKHGWKFSMKVFEEDLEHDIEKLKDVKEQIINAIGGTGKWQLRKCMYIILVIWLPASFHLLNMVFFRAPTDFWCESQIADEELWRNISGPDNCHMYDIDWKKFGSNHSENPDYNTAVESNKFRACVSFQYDRSFWERTIVQDFNLVCDDAHMDKWTQQVTFFGLLCGVFASGLISDRFGRVKTMMVMLTINIMCGTLTAFSPNYAFFLAGIWFCGFSSIGFGTVMYCWMMEILSGKTKTIFGCAPHLNYAFWGFAVAVIAYLIPDWHQMELVFSVPLIALYVTYWILPESPRWLLAQGRTAEAEQILRKIADFNGRPLADSFKLHSPPITEHHAKGRGLLGFLELFKTPNLRVKTMITYYLWFATSLIYYGLTLNSNGSGDSLFVYFCFGKAMEFPAIILVIFLLLKAGRRLTLLILYVICGFALLATIAVPTGYEWPLIVLNIIGRASSTGTLALCYVYSAEIFPTVIRNVGIGSSSVWARVGPMLAPYIASLASFEPRLPIAVFGGVALVAAFLVSFLPETADHKLPDTIEEGEEMGKGDTLWRRPGCCF